MCRPEEPLGRLAYTMSVSPDGYVETPDQIPDEYRLVVHPMILGSGTALCPSGERPIGLRLIEARAVGSGAVLPGDAAR